MKCKFVKKCELFSEDSVTCMKNAGVYYGYDRYAGCWIKMKEKLKESEVKE